MRKKNIAPFVLVAGVLALIGVTAYYVLQPQLQPHTSLRFGDGVFTARVVKSQDHREKGLSGTRSLRESQAMIFVFPIQEKWSISMKGMNYPLDIIWLDDEKNVIFIVKNADPESYPKRFSPRSDAKYVVEVPAGTVAKKSITIGTAAIFDEDNLERGIKL